MSGLPPRGLSLAVIAVALGCTDCATPPPPAQRSLVARPAVTPREAPRDARALDPRAGALLAEVTAEGAAVGVPLVLDDALSDVAREVLRRSRVTPEHRSPGSRVVQAIAWGAGVSDPIPAVVVMRRSPGAWSEPAREGLRGLLRADRPTHMGVAVEGIDADELVVLTFTQRRVSLDRFPRSAPVGHPLRLRGVLGAGLREPMLVLTRPDGTTRERSMGAGPDFDATVALDSRGAWQVEVLANSAQGATVVANLPVYVAVEPPPIPEASSPSGATTAEAVASELRSLVDEARRVAGAPPVARLELLDRVSQAHSDDMSAHRFVAHVSPSTGGHADRLRAAGFVAGIALENVARGYDAREIHEGLLASPGHRANLLNPEVTHVGVGVAREVDGPAWLVTQLFAELPRTLDPAAEVARLLEQVNALRRARALVPLQTHPALVAAARAAATRFFAQPQSDQQVVLQDAARSVQGEGGVFRRVTVAAAFGPRVAGAEQSPSLLEAELRAVGIGVAQGDRPHQPAGSVLVVFVAAVPR